jgi:hypothetical protein
MTPERRAKIEHMYHVAVTRDVKERSAVLTQECEGDHTCDARSSRSWRVMDERSS